MVRTRRRPVPLWLMTSEATEAPTRARRSRAAARRRTSRRSRRTSASRLTREGRLFLGDDGQPSTYAPGHGDLPDALRRSGLLRRSSRRAASTCGSPTSTTWARQSTRRCSASFIERATTWRSRWRRRSRGPRGHSRVGRRGRGRGARASPSGARGVPAAARLRRRDRARLQHEHVPRAGRGVADRRVARSWFEVEKKVGARTAVQFERLLQELTAAMPRTCACRATESTRDSCP